MSDVEELRYSGSVEIFQGGDSLADGERLPSPEVAIHPGVVVEDQLASERDALKLKVAELNVALNDAFAENDSLHARIRELEAKLADASA